MCDRNLTELTLAARAEHENRCVDSLNPKKKRNERQARLTRNPRRPPTKQPVSHDDRVNRFLELLGLERYAHRFAEEEIDFPALRLLKDSDFAHLRIPDAARRRIADALTAVPVLAQIEGLEVDTLPSDPEPLPTQKFQASNLGRQMKRNKPLLNLDDSDGEYVPTPMPQHSPVETNSIPNQGLCERSTDNVEEDMSNEDTLDVDNDDLDDFQEIERIVKSNNTASASETSDLSSLPSDMEDLNDLLSSTSQITLELKLQKWRRKQIQNENDRHRRELQRIEEEYSKLATSKKVVSSDDEDKGPTPDPPRVPEHDCDTIDLTQDVLAEGDNKQPAGLKISTTENVEDSIVISSNETVVKDATIIHADEQHQKKECESHGAKQKDMAQVNENIMKGSSRPRSPCSETCTPTQNKSKQIYGDEEVIDLISSKKKPRAKLGSSSPLSQAQRKDEQMSQPVRTLELPRREITSDSDEDFMDLLGVENENTRSSTGPTSSATDAPKRACTENEISATEEAPSQSRLKKRPKKVKRVMATATDIAQLVRKDKALYEDILMMESIPFDHILTRLRGGEKHITKKALYNFLQDEGILFKGDSIEPGSQQQAYMRLLNSDMCPD